MPVFTLRRAGRATLAGVTLAAGLGVVVPSALADPGPAAPKVEAASVAALSRSSWPIERRGSHGPNVRTIQYLMRDFSDATRFLAVDGIYGPDTERAVRLYQESRQLAVDGIVGPRTWSKLANEFPVRRGDRGPDVAAAQTELDKHGQRLAVDGVFGPRTDRAVRAYQRSHHLAVDGIVGPRTWHSLVATGN